MKSYLRFSAFALLGLFLFSGNAFAVVTHADGDIYGDPYTVENSSGNWTYAGSQTVQGSFTATGNISATSGTIVGKTPATIIASTANTIGTVTLAKTGYMFIVTANQQGDAASIAPWVLTLPSTNSTATNSNGAGGAFSGETYTFTTATSLTIAVRTASATDASIAYGPNGGGATGGTVTRITSPASTGTTVTLVGYGRVWYVKSMSNGNSATTAGPNWTPGAF